MDKPDALFLRLHRLGLMRLAVRFSRAARREVLNGVHGNTHLITNQLARVDLVTDSLMHLPGTARFPSGKGRRESDFMSLGALFQEGYGYEHVLPAAQGRTAELVLASTVAAPGKVVLHNLLFPTTRLHPEVLGAEPRAIPVAEAHDLHGDHPFKGNLDLEALKAFVRDHGADRIAYVMVETSVNAVGGHPVSMQNIREVHQYARSVGALVFIDACRLRENAWFIREREPGYAERSIADIVREFCSHSDGCTMSATKDFPVDAGGFIATRREDLHFKFQDRLMLVGEGLSVDAKARLYLVLRKSLRSEKLLRRRVRNARELWTRLKAAGVPVVSPPAGYAVFIDTAGLLGCLPKDRHPERAFLYQLYLESGILAAENMLTPEQEAKGVRMIRLAIPLGHYNPGTMKWVAGRVADLWSRRREIPGLKQTRRPDCRTGDYLAEYERL